MADSDNESDFASAESDQEEPSTTPEHLPQQEEVEPRGVGEAVPREPEPDGGTKTEESSEDVEPRGVGEAVPREPEPDGGTKTEEISEDVDSEEQEPDDKATVGIESDESKRPKDVETLESEPKSSQEDDNESQGGRAGEADSKLDGSDKTEEEKRDTSGVGTDSGQDKKELAAATADGVSHSKEVDSSADSSKDDMEGQKSSGEPIESSKGESVESRDSGTERKGEELKGSAGAAGGGWGWGGWSSLWSSVSTVTESAQALGHKVTSVIASVEDTLGLPSPQDLADTTKEVGGEEEEVKGDEEKARLAEEMVEHDVPSEDQPVLEEPHPQQPPPSQPHSIPERTENLEQEPKQQSPSSFAGFAGFFSGIASAVQSTGKELVTGGLDALETLGKKTMEVLSEGDPGLRKKRALLGGAEAPNLSQLLKEAKAEAEIAAKMKEAEGASYSLQQPLSYSRLFDEYQGVVHLEALELLSKECVSKVRSSLSGFSGDELQALREELDKIAQAFKVEDQVQLEVLDDDSSKLSEVLELFSNVTLPLKVEKLIKVSNSWREKVQQGEVSSDTEENREDESLQPSCEALYEDGLRSLAEMTSASIELFRKMAEVSLLPDAEKTNALEQTQRFNRLTMLVSSELDALASVHAEAITRLDVKESNSAMTSLYLESSNSCSYVQDAFQLLCPVLQFKRIQESSISEPSANVHARS